MSSEVKVIQRCAHEEDLYRYAERTLPPYSGLYPYIALHLKRCERCRLRLAEYINREIH